MKSQYFWYMSGIGTFGCLMGVHAVLFPWLIAVELNASPEALGIAQMSGQLPGLILVLIGGVLADRKDPRTILVYTHLLACLPIFALAALLHLGVMSYSLMIVYAILVGAIIAFVQPARDAMLNRIAGDQLQKTVTVTMGLVFGGQIIGFFVAGFAELTGAVPILILQGCLFLIGAAGATRLHHYPPIKAQVSAQKTSALADIKAGLSLVLKSTSMRPVLVLLTAMSMFFGGTFVVLNPIIVRDIYQGNAAEISIAFGAFMAGTITMSIFLVLSGGIRHPGRGLLIALLFGGIALAIASLGLPFYGYLGCIFLWGIGGGVAMSMARTIMQEAAPAEYRARVMSVFSLANLGGMPFGALLMGYSATWFGPLASLWVAIIGVWSVILVILITSDLASKSSTTKLISA